MKYDKINLIKYYILTTLLVLSIFTFIVPIIYYTITGLGYAHTLDIVQLKYHPNRKKISFIRSWFLPFDDINKKEVV